MGRRIVFLSLAVALCPDIAAAAPSTSHITLPNSDHVRRHHRAPVIKAAAMRLPARSVFDVEKPAAQDQLSDHPRRRREHRRLDFGRAGSDCNGGKRIMAAYYWEGRRTASGQPFNLHGMTAAHRTLPFGTTLTVSNPRTGKSVTVVVNDRGPYVSGVSLDLSLGAAQAIGMRGTGAVRI
jgi:rare lipoprotein A